MKENYFMNIGISLTESQLKMLNYMIDKKILNNGIIIGYHGTSKTRAEQIIEKGFEDRNDRKIVGESPGVFVWDEEFKGNATSPGKKAAIEDDDTEYALIKVKILNPEPDFKMGRPQWKGLSKDITILGVEFYSIDPDTNI